MPRGGVVICESPGKISKIAEILGPRYTVLATAGHLWDLPPRKMGVHPDTYAPEYEVTSRAQSRVAELRRACQGQTVWLAADADREGEAIAWSVTQLVSARRFYRISFHSITRSAIEQALRERGDLNLDLVHAQTARRVLDRLCGYTLSPLLARAVPGAVSAGRVQSVAAKTVQEVCQRHDAAVRTGWWDVSAVAGSSGEEALTWRAVEEDGSSLHLVGGARRLIRDTYTDRRLEVTGMTSEEGRTAPPPPFQTSTLQSTCTAPLRESVRGVMRLAQRLYEGGWITYLRTDCTDLAEECHAQIREHVVATYGRRAYRRREGGGSQGSQEAHEAIRPTAISTLSLEGLVDDPGQVALYRLIWERTVASQMEDYRYLQTTVEGITPSLLPLEAHWQARGVTTVRLGWRVFSPPTEHPLPVLEVGQRLRLQSVRAEETLSRPPPLWSEAAAVSAWQRQGIGRPSTYGSILQTLADRGYVSREDGAGEPVTLETLIHDHQGRHRQTREEHWGAYRGKLRVSPLGERMIAWMESAHPALMEISYTRHLEEELDRVAAGEREWVAVVRQQTEVLPMTAGGTPGVVEGPPLTHGGLEVTRHRGRQGAYLQVGPFALRCPEEALKDPETWLTEYPVWRYHGVYYLLREGKWGPYLQSGTPGSQEVRHHRGGPWWAEHRQHTGAEIRAALRQLASAPPPTRGGRRGRGRRGRGRGR